MMNLEIEICGVKVKPLNLDLEYDNYVGTCPAIIYSVNGKEFVEWVKVSEYGYTLERVDTYESTNSRDEMKEASGLDWDDYDDFKDQLWDYLQETLDEEYAEKEANDPDMYELRCERCEPWDVARVEFGSIEDKWIWGASTVEELERYYMRELKDRFDYYCNCNFYIAEVGTHKIIKHF